MPKILLFIFAQLFALNLWAQVSGVVFVGSISLKGTDTHYPYKLKFTDSNGVITGYSVTDPRGPVETESRITGTINKSNKEINFREINIVNTKSDAPKDSFCFLHAHLKVVTLKGTKALKGHFEGFKPDGSSCGKGDIFLFSAQEVLDKLMQIAEKKDTTKNKIIPAATDIKPDKLKEIAPGNDLDIECENSLVTIDVWDNAKIDGDIVSIEHNGSTVLDHYMIKGDMKELSIKMQHNTDTLKVIAISEGIEPPATARLKIRSGSAVYYIDARCTLKDPVSVILRLKK